MRRRAQGFTLIEIMVVIAIIAGLVTTVAIIVPKMQENQKRLSCQQNLSQLGQLYLLEEQENKAKAQRYSGVAMWLSYRKKGPGMKIKFGEEKSLFCPGDSGLAPAETDEDKKKWDAPDLENPPTDMCSYAARDFKNHPINIESPEKEIVGSDRQGPDGKTPQHIDGLVCVFTAGDAPFMNREQLGIDSESPIVVGPESPTKHLQKLVYAAKKRGD